MGIISDFLKSRAANPDSVLLPDQLNKLFKEYLLKEGDIANIGLGQNQEAAKAFDAYLVSRTKNIDNFSKINIGDKTIDELLKAGNTAANKIKIETLKDAIAKALIQTADTENAKQTFNSAIAKIQADVKNTASDSGPRDWIHALREAEIKAIKAIETQHETEKKALEQNITPQILSAAFDCTEDQAKKIKADMIESLEKSQQKELSQFESDVQKTITNICNEQISFLALLYKGNKENRKKMDALIEAKGNNEKDSGIAVKYNPDEGTASFKGIKIQDLPSITAITSGHEITQIPTGTFNMKFPNRWWKPLYSNGYTKGMKDDMMQMAMAVKESNKDSGNNSITMSVSHKKDQEHAMELARTAYAACRESGFPATEITIKVNGKVMSRDEIFANAPSLLQAIETRAASNDKKRPAASESTKHFKDEMKKGRKSAPDQTPAPETDEKTAPKPAAP